MEIKYIKSIKKKKIHRTDVVDDENLKLKYESIYREWNEKWEKCVWP